MSACATMWRGHLSLPRRHSCRRLTCPASLRAHIPRLGIFQERVKRRHMGDRQSFDSIEETALQEITAYECPGRIDDQIAQSDLGLPEDQFFGGERRVSIHGPQMLGKRIARKVKK